MQVWYSYSALEDACTQGLELEGLTAAEAREVFNAMRRHGWQDSYVIVDIALQGEKMVSYPVFVGDTLQCQ